MLLLLLFWASSSFFFHSLSLLFVCLLLLLLFEGVRGREGDGGCLFVTYVFSNLYVSLLQLKNISREFRVVFLEESKLEQRHPARPD